MQHQGESHRFRNEFNTCLILLHSVQRVRAAAKAYAKSHRRHVQTLDRISAAVIALTHLPTPPTVVHADHSALVVQGAPTVYVMVLRRFVCLVNHYAATYA